MKLNKDFLQFIRQVFVIGFVLLAIFIIMELIKPKIVATYIDLNWLAGIILALGIITVLLHPENQSEPRKLRFWDYSAIILLSILVGLGVYFLTSGIGLMSIAVGIVSAVVCYLFITFVLKV